MSRACAISFALLLAAPTVAAQVPAPQAAKSPVAASYVKPAPPGRLVDIGGRRLHILCKGKPVGPVIIFEDGLSQYPAEMTFGKAQDLIATFAQVCVYDRAGLGWSDPVPGARTQADMVDDLHKLVVAEGFKRPLVLVGFSMGGLLVRRYAKAWPSDVAGVVLVDSTPVGMVFTPAAANARQAVVAKINGALNGAAEGAPVVALPAGTAAEAQMAYTPAILRTLRQEYQAIDRVPPALRKPGAYGTLDDTPLAIIRRGKMSLPPSAEDIAWRKAQEALQSLSSRSVLIVARHSGHVVPYEAPEVLAVAVRHVLDQIGQQSN